MKDGKDILSKNRRVKMSNKNFFPRRPPVAPSIYAYDEPGNTGLSGFLKIGFTNGDVRKRVAQQYPTARPGKLPYRIVTNEFVFSIVFKERRERAILTFCIPKADRRRMDPFRRGDKPRNSRQRCPGPRVGMR